jgi:hypothetical protein
MILIIILIVITLLISLIKKIFLFYELRIKNYMHECSYDDILKVHK